MIQGKKKKPQVFFDSDDDRDLDLFCRIEEALQNDTQDNNYFIQQQEQSRLASEFPTSFIQNSKSNDTDDQSGQFAYDDDNENTNNQSLEISKEEIIQFHEMYKKFQAKLCFLSEKEKEIDRDSSWLKKEKKELEREKKRIEADKVIAEANLSNIELLDLRQKYDELQKKYETEKNEWIEEKKLLLQQIEELKGDAPIQQNQTKNKAKYKSNLSQIKQTNKFNLNDSKIQNKSNKKESQPERQIKNKSDDSFHASSDLPENQNVDNDSYQSNSSSSSTFLSQSKSKKQEITSSAKKNKPLKQKFSVFTNVPLHPNYHLDLSFDPGPVLKEEIKSNDGRKLLRYKNNISATLFPNGTQKMRYKDTVFIIYANGDTAQEFKDGARGYRYAETGAVELQLPDNTVYYEFPELQTQKNGSVQKINTSLQYNIKQREIHHPDGEKEIMFPNGVKKILHLNGDYEIYHLSGRVEKCINGNVVNIYD